MEMLMYLVFIVIGLVIYFLPSILAHGERKFGGVLALNIFLGWTVLGWVIAVIWASCKEKQEIKTEVTPTAGN